jgi:hypothetical protein
VLFTNAVSILSVILTGILPLPTWDGALATADHALGLNWLDMYQWLTGHPAIEAGAHTVYMGLGPEMLILFVALELLATTTRQGNFYSGSWFQRLPPQVSGYSCLPPGLLSTTTFP